MLHEAPFPFEVQETIIAAVERIIAIEQARENMARTDRSALHPDAQPYQDFIDRLFYRMAGLTDDEAAGLEQRLARMLYTADVSRARQRGAGDCGAPMGRR